MSQLTINLNNAISPAEQDSLQDFEKAWLVTALPKTEADYAVNLPAHMVRDLYWEVLCFGPNHEKVLSVVHCMESHFKQVQPKQFLDFGEDEFVDSITDLMLASETRRPPVGSEYPAYQANLLSSFSRAVQDDVYGSAPAPEEKRPQLTRLRFSLAWSSSALIQLLPPTYNIFVEAELYQNPCELDFIIENMLWTLVGEDVFRAGSKVESIRPQWEKRILHWMECNS